MSTAFPRPGSRKAHASVRSSASALTNDRFRPKADTQFIVRSSIFANRSNDAVDRSRPPELHATFMEPDRLTESADDMTCGTDRMGHGKSVRPRAVANAEKTPPISCGVGIPRELESLHSLKGFLQFLL